MGMADIAEVLWNDYLKHNPGNARWIDRDRFVLSNGHGSMLLYSLLHLSGYDLSMDEIRNFRQLGYRTAGHPERDPDLSIETTTGPLGQGIANAVGMALGFALALFCLGATREILGAGTLFAGLPFIRDGVGFVLFGEHFEPWVIMLLPPGGFLMLGVILLFFNWVQQMRAARLRTTGAEVPG